MIKRLLCLFLPVLLLYSYAFIANDNIKTITQALEKFRKTYPQEKIHLHLDKPCYSIGDTIYFKAYVVNAEKNLPSAISNILYVDVIDENNNIQQTLRRPVTDGVAWGTIVLNDSLPEGIYKIRSYTNWMRNFDESYFFDEVITVGNALTNDIVTSATFKFNAAANKDNDTAVIIFKSLRGYHVAGKEVNYNIAINKKEVQKGKAKTDDNGKLLISFAGIHSINNQPAEITTHVRLDNKTTFIKVIKFELPAANHRIDFFPEGGQMVNGIPARIGFKAISVDGSGINVSGEVTDETSVNVVTFKSDFAGMGSFIFTPESNHSYHAVLHYENGTTENAELPKAEEYGYVLAADNADPEQVKINITAKQQTPSEDVTLVAQCNNRMQYAATLPLNNGNASSIISKKKFPTGIVQFTLFNAAAQPVAERLVFINHHDQLNIKMSLDNNFYNRKEHVKMMLTVKDNKGNPVTGNFSIAVTDGNAIPNDNSNRQSVLSNLLLTSDMKGYIENPGYYFTDVNNDKATALDNLLLTQGWRRFIWKEILADKYPDRSFAIEKSLVISGKVLSAKGEPIAHKKVNLISKKGPGYVLDTLTAADGTFTFDELDFEDDKPFVLQVAKEDGGKDVQIKLNNFSPPPVTNNKNFYEAKQASAIMMQPYLVQSAHRFDEMKKNGLLQDKHTLKEVIITTKKLTRTQEAVAPSANLNGPGHADQIITYEDLRNCSELAQCLPGKLTGVIFKYVLAYGMDSRNPTYLLQPFSSLGMGAPMLVILDGMNISGAQGLDIRNIPARDIQSIEVLRSGAYLSSYGTRAAGGVLVITTRHGGIDYDADADKKPSMDTKSNVVLRTVQGYSISRKFYSPDYSHTSGNETMPDLRSTIYWQPYIKTDDDGKAAIDFYNGENAATYNVVIEGLSDDGKPGSASFSYQVK